MSTAMDGNLSIYDNTRDNAQAAAAPRFASRRGRILQLLAERGPSTLFEIAQIMELHDHQISGRFTELAGDGLIRKTGARRTKPETHCEADVWALADPAQKLDVGAALNHPLTLKIADEGIFERLPWLSHEGTGGVPYAPPASSSLPRVIYRVVLMECDRCGKPLQLERDSNRKCYLCPTCRKRYRLMLVCEPGKSEMLALVLTHL